MPEVKCKKCNDVIVESDGGKLSEGDVSADVDLITAIANLIKIEEHLENTYETTKNELYLKIRDEVRRDRGLLLGFFLKNEVKDSYKDEGDLWCIFKHSLSVWFGLKEVAAKYLSESRDALEEGKEEMAKQKMEAAKMLFDVAMRERARMILALNILKEKNKKSQDLNMFKSHK